LNHLQVAILCTVAYADVFDYALTPAQVHHYLVAYETTRESVRHALEGPGRARERLEQRDGLLALRGREDLFELRRHRAAIAAELWPLARRFANAIAALPFVRAITLTGALAVGNCEADDDFDYLIITAPGRLWLTRALIIGLVVKPAARRGYEVCPNYLLSEGKLIFAEQNLYVAHELAQMVPLAGTDVYRRLRTRNAWCNRFLPNASGLPRRIEPSITAGSSLSSLAELALGTFVGGQLERFERRRKIRRFTARTDGAATTCFDENHCKGHFESNEQLIQQAFAERLRSLAADERIPDVGGGEVGP
jgi:hypothetical protein